MKRIKTNKNKLKTSDRFCGKKDLNYPNTKISNLEYFMNSEEST